jgi:membrane protein required for colicin V production
MKPGSVILVGFTCATAWWADEKKAREDMNWIDIALVVLLLAAIVIGSRRGLFSGIMGTLGLIAGVTFSINYMDQVTAKFLSHMRVSPVMVVFVGFIVVFVLVYVGIKLFGYLFYKFADLKPLGNLDKVGGAIMGIFQGWIVLGVLLFLLIFLPLPDTFVAKLDSSFFAPGMRGVVPMIYDESTPLHPQHPSLVEQVRRALTVKPGKSAQDWGELTGGTPSISRIIRSMEDYFGS